MAKIRAGTGGPAPRDPWGAPPPRPPPVALAGPQRQLRDALGVALGFLVAQVQGARPSFESGVVGHRKLHVGLLQVADQGRVVDRDRGLAGERVEERLPLVIGIPPRAVEE